MGATTGTVTHYFRSKAALVGYALELLAQRRDEGERAAPDEPVEALRAALLGMLPLDPTSRSATRIWVSSWDAALPSADRSADHAGRYRRSRDTLAGIVAAALSGAQKEADAIVIAEQLQATMLGLATQAVLDPDAYPADVLSRLVDAAIARWIGPRLVRA
ncbi:TetR family transcriptional regulator [Microbacterium sp. PM5]|nr:TetR family transcriptional regulator [Microbacterium sp. PM5]